jgi:hypothetical protein
VSSGPVYLGRVLSNNLHHPQACRLMDGRKTQDAFSDQRYKMTEKKNTKNNKENKDIVSCKVVCPFFFIP